jgi:protein-disulfide isomerase
MRRLGFALAAALALAACKPADKAAHDQAVAYLVNHPDAIQEAADKYQAKRLSDARAALPKIRAALEHDPRDFVANPNGRVTITEFYDYRCPHCTNIAPKVVDLVRRDPDIRFVFKEMPIFGATSEHAARAALAVKQAGGDYLGLYEAFMATHPLDDQTIDQIAVAKGANLAVLNSKALADATQAQLADVQKLAAALAIEGTPGFIVGDQIIPGEDIDAINAAVAQQRGRGATGRLAS